MSLSSLRGPRRRRDAMNINQPIGPRNKTTINQPTRGPKGQRVPGGGRQVPLFGDSTT